jgi:hypothetical protein
MIASPGDVAAERHAVRQVIHERNVVNAEARRIVLMRRDCRTLVLLAGALDDRVEQPRVDPPPSNRKKRQFRLA